MVKIFIGNLSAETQPQDVRILFEKYGAVEECDVLKNYGFVHMENKSEANAAIAKLDGYNIKGQRMRVELSTGKKGDKKGDGRDMRRGPPERGGHRSRPYPAGPPRGRLPPPPPDFDRYDPYYPRYPYPERDPYYRLPPADRYLPRLPPPADRYGLPPLPRDRLLPEERGAYPDPRDRLMARERLPPYPEDRAAAVYADRLRAALPRADPYRDPYGERSPPPARPPPEYYDRKPSMMRAPAAGGDSGGGRLNTTAYPPANGQDYYARRPATAAARSDYNGAAASGQDYYAAPPSRGGAGGYERPAPQQQQGGGGYGMQQQQASKSYDSQTALQTQPIFF